MDWLDADVVEANDEVKHGAGAISPAPRCGKGLVGRDCRTERGVRRSVVQFRNEEGQDGIAR